MNFLRKKTVFDKARPHTNNFSIPPAQFLCPFGLHQGLMPITRLYSFIRVDDPKVPVWINWPWDHLLHVSQRPSMSNGMRCSDSRPVNLLSAPLCHGLVLDLPQILVI